MYIMGGNTDGSNFNDVWALSLSSETWTSVVTSGDGPSPGWGSSAVLDAATNTMIIYGGTGAPEDVWALSLSSHTWTNIPTSNKPTGRYVHTAVFDAATNSMYIFGGYGPTLFDTWALSFSSNPYTSNTWTSISTSGPSKRYSHSSVLDPATRTVYIFGGYTDDGSSYLNDVWALSLSSNTWTPVSTSGDGPSARSSHSFVFDAATSAMYIMGGYDNTGSCLNDVWALNLLSHTWSVLPTPGTFPPSLFHNLFLCVVPSLVRPPKTERERGGYRLQL
jgi:N-acetylneuraminic acid mutarotase